MRSILLVVPFVFACSSAAPAVPAPPASEPAPRAADASCPAEKLAVGDARPLPAGTKQFSVGKAGPIDVKIAAGGPVANAVAPGTTRVIAVLADGSKSCVEYEVK